MKIKNRKGMQVTCAAAVTTEQNSIVFASLIGAQTAVKAIWASVLNRRTALHISGRRSSYYTGDPDVEYITLKQSPAQGVHHWVMYPEPGPDSLFLLMIPLQRMTEQEQLVKLLNHHTLWPVKDEWALELWDRGVIADDEGACLIQELKTHGDLAWAYAVNTIGWDDVIDQAAKDGCFTFS